MAHSMTLSNPALEHRRAISHRRVTIDEMLNGVALGCHEED